MEQSLGVCQELVDIRKKTLPESDLRLLQAQIYLAAAYRDTGNVQAAIDLLVHMREVSEKTYPPSHTMNMKIKFNLAYNYWKKNQLKEAIDLFKVVIDNYEKNTSTICLGVEEELPCKGLRSKQTTKRVHQSLDICCRRPKQAIPGP
jgi:hypothetical protein